MFYEGDEEVVREGLSEYPNLLMLMKLCNRDWKNNLERMNINVDESNGKTVVMMNVWDQKAWRFSCNEFRNNIGFLASAPKFGLGGLRILEKEESQKRIVNKRKTFSCSVRVFLYEVCLSYIIYCLLFYIMTILTPFHPIKICGISHTRGKEFMNYCP